MESYNITAGIKSILMLAALALFYTGCTSTSAVVDEQKGKSIFLADPTIFHHDGTFYLYGTGSNKGFTVYTSSDLRSWEGPKGVNNGHALLKGESFGSRGFWAPQVLDFNDKFYMAYTANESIAIAESESPLGPFKQTELKALEAPVRQIDPFIFIDDDGTKYLYHVRVANGGNRIYVAELKDDFSGIKTETLKLCIDATEHWEDTENAKWTVIEGPTVIKRNDLYYLIYSANHFKSKDYAVGYAVSNSPYGPWEKYEGNPIISRNNVNEPGAGHGDLFNDGDDFYYVFHTHNSDTTVGPRRTALIKAEFGSASEAAPLGVKENTFQYLTVPEH